MPNIILGVTSSIAIYKSADLLRQLVKKDWNVKVVMTPMAKEMVSPLLFSSLGAEGVYWDLFLSKTVEKIESHISLSKWGEYLVIAPCTANTISKISLGIADNLLTSLALSFKPERTIIAPAMHTQMYLAPVIQEHIHRLTSIGVAIIGPEQGDLASGDQGVGRLAGVEKILSYLERVVASNL